MAFSSNEDRTSSQRRSRKFPSSLEDFCNSIPKNQIPSQIKPPRMQVPRFSLVTPSEFFKGSRRTKSLILIDEFQDPLTLKAKDRPRKMSCYCTPCGGYKLAQKFITVKALSFDVPVQKRSHSKRNVKNLMLPALVDKASPIVTSTPSSLTLPAPSDGELSTLNTPLPTTVYVGKYLKETDTKRTSSLAQIKPVVSRKLSSDLLKKTTSIKTTPRTHILHKKASLRPPTSPKPSLYAAKTPAAKLPPLVKLPQRKKHNYLHDYNLTTKAADELISQVKHALGGVKTLRSDRVLKTRKLQWRRSRPN